MSDRYNQPNLQIGDIAQRCWFAILVICQSRREDGLSRGSFRNDDNDREMIRWDDQHDGLESWFWHWLLFPVSFRPPMLG